MQKSDDLLQFISGATERFPRTIEWLPWILAVTAVGLFMGLVVARGPDAGRAPGAAAVAKGESRPYVGTWAFKKEGRVVFTETYNSDGTWHRRPGGNIGAVKSGHWTEANGVITVTYLQTDPETDRQRLFSDRWWWFLTPDRKTLSLAVFGDDGFVQERVDLKKP